MRKVRDGEPATAQGRRPEGAPACGSGSRAGLPPVPALAALQRAAGNAAVTRLVVQRQLVIRSRDKRFTDPNDAREYLWKRFEGRFGKAPEGDQVERLEKLAGEAKDPNEVTEVSTLTKALAYIQTGTALDLPRQSVDPSQSPVRKPPPEWSYGMTGGSPSSFELPQSPQRTFPEKPHEPLSLDVPGMLGGQEKFIKTERGKHSDYKFGKNLFSYGAKASLRFTPMEARSTGGSRYFGPAAVPVTEDFDVQSRLYQSRFELTPEVGEEKGEDFSGPMRDEMQHIYDTKGGHPTLGDLSIFSKEKSGDYFKEAKSGAISSLYVHSEVQAGAHAHRGAARVLARALVREIEVRARKHLQPKAAVEAVVISVAMAGFSEPNSVCGNACKGALVHVAELFEKEFEKARSKAKAELRDDGIYLRASAEFTVSGHARGRKKFQGYGTGAEKLGGLEKAPRHRRFYEYEPY